MIIVVETLSTTLTQEFTTTTRMQLGAIRPRLYLHNDPAGTFTIAIKDGSTTIGSSSLSMAQILSSAGFTPGQYHHGFFTFEFSAPPILNPGDYTVELSASGYSFSESSYLGWIRDHEDLLVDYTGTIETDLQKPLSFQLWSYDD